MRSCVGYQHSRFLSILTCFVHYYSRFWGPKAISMLVEPQGALTCRPSTTVVLVDSGPFQGLLLNPRVRLRVGHRYSRFLSCLTRFVDYYSPFWGPKAISIVVKPKVCLRVVHQHSQFWPILTRFVDYYSPFWGPKVISMVVEPQGAVTCRSSTLAVLADSDPVLGLLVTVLGSRSKIGRAHV